MSEEDDQILSVLRELTPLGDGVDYVDCDRVWESYREAALRNGWSTPLKRPGLTRWMNRHGFLRQTYKRPSVWAGPPQPGRPCWLVSHSKFDYIAGGNR